MATTTLDQHREANAGSDALAAAELEYHEPEGAYYVLASYGRLGFGGDVEAMNGLIDQVGVGSVAGNAFFPSEANTGLLRFCFALTDDELDRGCEMLASRPIRA